MPPGLETLMLMLETIPERDAATPPRFAVDPSTEFAPPEAAGDCGSEADASLGGPGDDKTATEADGDSS